MPQENAELRRKVDFLAAKLAESEASAARRHGRGDGTGLGEDGEEEGGGTGGPNLRRLRRDYEELQVRLDGGGSLNNFHKYIYIYMSRCSTTVVELLFISARCIIT